MNNKQNKNTETYKTTYMSEKNKKTRLQQIGQNNSKEEENKEKVEEENNEREDKIIRL